jgi:hypothetical protein
MGEIDRTAAAKCFEDALEQFEDSLEGAEDPDPGASKSPPSSVKPESVPLPLEAKLLRRLRSPQREQQLAAMEAAIADLEAFLSAKPSPPIQPDSEF